MDFSTFRKQFSNKIYAPLPKSVLNELAIAKNDNQKIALSCQRLIIRAMSKLVRFDSTSDANLFEYFSVGNEAIMYSISTYTHDKIDFAYYTYMNIRNSIISYRRSEEPLIKKRVIKGEVKFAEYLLVDGLESNPLELLLDESSIEIQFDLEYIFEELSKGKSALKEKSWSIFKCAYGLTDGKKKSNAEVARIHGMTGENVGQAVKRTLKLIQKNEQVMTYLENILYQEVE